MSSDTTRREALIARLQDFDYRHDLDDEANGQGISFQLRAMRSERGWNQSEVASRAGMKQSRISELENPDYESYSLATLKRLARAYDVSLRMRFEPFSAFVNHQIGLAPSDLAVPSFDGDVGLRRDVAPIAAVSTATNSTYSQIALPDPGRFEEEGITYLPAWLLARQHGNTPAPPLVSLEETAHARP